MLDGDINEFNIPNYSVVQLDRNRHGGGVALFIHDSLLHNVIVSGPSGLELLTVSILLNLCELYWVYSIDIISCLYFYTFQMYFHAQTVTFLHSYSLGDFNGDFSQLSFSHLCIVSLCHRLL